MGHQIEYFASIRESAVRAWLDRLSGFYLPEPGDMSFGWEGQLASGGTFWAYMATDACNFTLAMNYTGLFLEQAPAVDFVRRFEEEFWTMFRTVPLLRVDELLVGEWFRTVGREWWELPQPIVAFRDWLQSHESHWHWLIPKQK